MKIQLSAAILTLVGIGLATQAQASGNGALNITGSIVASTCSVGSSSGTINVPMGNIDVSSLATPGARAGQQRFSIALDCNGATAGDQVGIKFEGPHDPDNGNLRLTANSTATNVTVGLATADDIHQPIGAAPVRWVSVEPSNPVNVDYYAYYQAGTSAATTGSANATATFTIVYQ